jgi:Ca-activated chloride channel family protein
MSPTRRRLLGLLAAGGGGALAGCAGLGDLSVSPGGDPEDDTDDPKSGKIDDWQYDPAEDDETAQGTQVAYSAGSGGASADAGIGLSAGGAGSVATFRRNVREGYLPLPESMSYEGLFHEYYFDTGGDGSCTGTFCPRYATAVTPDPLSGETERYLSVGLDSGIAQSAFERPALNLVVALDVSGSMGSTFDEYHYDATGEREAVEGTTDRPKIEVAKDALVSLTEQLRPGDRFGVVLFNSTASVAKPLRRVEVTDMDAIRGHIREDVRAGGGTNVSDALDSADELMAQFDDADPTETENRTIVLTDAQINTGRTDDEGLQADLAGHAERGHHTTFVGIGVDFNSELVDHLTAIEGGNYYSVYSAEEFETRLGEEFAYMVTPLVYDLSLELDSDDYVVRQVYGSSAAEEATGELMRVNTLFPSPKTDGKAKGGVVLVQVDGPDGGAGDAELTATWRTRDGETHEATEAVSFPDGDGETYDTTAVRKATLLSRYADLMKNWTTYERDPELVAVEDGVGVPPDESELGEWERRSQRLVVSDRYRDRIGRFREHLASEQAAVGDDSLQRERDLLATVLDAPAPGETTTGE